MCLPSPWGCPGSGRKTRRLSFFWRAPCRRVFPPAWRRRVCATCPGLLHEIMKKTTFNKYKKYKFPDFCQSWGGWWEPFSSKVTDKEISCIFWGKYPDFTVSHFRKRLKKEQHVCMISTVSLKKVREKGRESNLFLSLRYVSVCKPEQSKMNLFHWICRYLPAKPPTC